MNFGAFDKRYDAFISQYRWTLKQISDQNSPFLFWTYHPNDAQAKKTKKGVGVPKEDVRIRRSCKGLMLFMANVRNNRIHFILDGIGEDNLFTDAELRHVTKYKYHQNQNFLAYRKGRSVSWEPTTTASSNQSGGKSER